MSLLSAFEHLLGGRSKPPAKPAAQPTMMPNSDNGRRLLGIVPVPSGQAPLVYDPPTPSAATVVPNQRPPLQMYGDVHGNRWLEDEAGNRMPVPQAPQAFDSRLNNSYHDQLRPGQTGPMPVNNGVFYPEARPKLNLRKI